MRYAISDRVRLASTREIDNAALTLGIRSVCVTHGLKLDDEGVVVSNAWNSPEHGSLFEVRFVRTNQTVICNAAMVAPYFATATTVPFGPDAPTPQWTTVAPIEPGWYWFQWATCFDSSRRRVYRILPGGYIAGARESDGPITAAGYSAHYGKWWPVRIEEPGSAQCK